MKKYHAAFPPPLHNFLIFLGEFRHVYGGGEGSEIEGMLKFMRATSLVTSTKQEVFLVFWVREGPIRQLPAISRAALERLGARLVLQMSIQV